MASHKIILYAKLEELYSSDPRLNRSIVDDSVKSGLETVLNQIRENPILVDYFRWKEDTVMEVIGGIHGSEHARALYELGMEIIPVMYDVARVNPNLGFDEIKGYTPIKVKEAPLLEDKEYREYYNMMEEYGYPLVLSEEELN